MKNPTNGLSFEFGEEEYFLCQSINGTSTPSQIIATFKSRFDLEITEDEFQKFLVQIQEYGLLESYNISDYSALEAALPLSLPSRLNDVDIKEQKQTDKKAKGKTKHYIWLLPNAAQKYRLLAIIFSQIKFVFQFLTWALIPGLIIAAFTIVNNQGIFWNDIHYIMSGGVPFLLHFLLNITLISLFVKIAQCTVFTACGGEVKRFGLTLTMGFHPRFYVDRTEMFNLSRQKQLWTFATPLLCRIGIMILGVLIWYFNGRTKTALGTGAILLAHSAFFEFLFDGSPLLPTDGYYLLITVLNLPPSSIKRVYQTWEMLFNRRPLPKSLSTKDKLFLILIGFLSIIFYWVFFFLIVQLWTTGLSDTFSKIFGRGTDVIILGLLTAIAIFKPAQKFLKQWQFNRNFNSISTEQPIGGKSKKFQLKNWKKILVFFIIAVILLLPYPYRPGGSIQLLPPTQQSLQAQVAGKVTKVFFKGGNGQWIDQNKVIANMESVDVENEVQVLNQSIKKQQAEVEAQKANLNKLIENPRPEDVAVAKQKVAVANQQVRVANQQIEVAKGQVVTATNKAEFSAREAARFKQLYQQGAYSLQQYENSEKQNELDRNDVAEKQQDVIESRQNLEVKKQSSLEAQANLAVVLSGSHPQEIAAARKQVEAALAEVQRLKQELKYNESQIQRTTLIMPISGRLTTPYLDQKVGTYLKQGETFAIAEDDRHITGELQIPEYSTEDFSLDGKVEIKLLSYPNRPIIGKVVSIQPNAVSDSTSSTTNNIQPERVINVIVDIPNTKKNLKAGMTGYAKIEGKTLPVIVAFTRPIVRFIQVEVWSWLP